MSIFSIYIFSSFAVHSPRWVNDWEKRIGKMICSIVVRMELLGVTSPRISQKLSKLFSVSISKVKTLLARTEHILNIVANEIVHVHFSLFFVFFHIVIEMMLDFSILCSKAKSIYVYVINSKFKFNIAVKLFVSSFDGFHGLEHSVKNKNKFFFSCWCYKPRQEGWHIGNWNSSFIQLSLLCFFLFKNIRMAGPFSVFTNRKLRDTNFVHFWYFFGK